MSNKSDLASTIWRLPPWGCSEAKFVTVCKACCNVLQTVMITTAPWGGVHPIWQQKGLIYYSSCERCKREKTRVKKKHSHGIPQRTGQRREILLHEHKIEHQMHNTVWIPGARFSARVLLHSCSDLMHNLIGLRKKLQQKHIGDMIQKIQRAQFSLTDGGMPVVPYQARWRHASEMAPCYTPVE